MATGLTTEICVQSVNEEMKKIARGPRWRKEARSICCFKNCAFTYCVHKNILQLCINCSLETTSSHKQLSLHADWIRHRSMPFSIMKKKHVNFLVQRSNIPLISPDDTESYPSRNYNIRISHARPQ